MSNLYAEKLPIPSFLRIILMSGSGLGTRLRFVWLTPQSYILYRSFFQSESHSPFQVVDGLKEELSVAQAKLNRLQHEADAKVLARAANNEVGRQGGGAGGVANKAPTSLEVKIPPVEQRSSGEVCFGTFYTQHFALIIQFL